MARCILMTGGGGGIMSEDTTVAAEDVLEGKTYLGSDTDDEIGVGTMPNNDSFSSTLNCGQSILIPRGYHTGSGKITANSLASQTPGNATAASMLNGRIAWVDGKKITGTIPSQGAATFSPSKGTTKTIITSGKYTSGDIKLAGFNMPDPSKLAKGYTYTLYGQSVTGTLSGYINDPSTNNYLIKNKTIQNNFSYSVTHGNVHGALTFGSYDSGMRFNQMINLSNIKYLKLVCNIPSWEGHWNYNHSDDDEWIQEVSSTLTVGLSTNPNLSTSGFTYKTTKTATNGNPSSGYLLIYDVSSINGNYYLYINFSTSKNNSAYYYAAGGITDIYLTNS